MDEEIVWKHFENIDEYHKNLDGEFKRLCAEPCMKVPKPGDVAIVAAGFLGMGHLWVREECEVLAVGDTSVKVRFKDYLPYGGERGSKMIWIHPSLITDVVQQNSNPTQGGS